MCEINRINKQYYYRCFQKVIIFYYDAYGVGTYKGYNMSKTNGVIISFYSIIIILLSYFDEFRKTITVNPYIHTHTHTCYRTSHTHTRTSTTLLLVVSACMYTVGREERYSYRSEIGYHGDHLNKSSPLADSLFHRHRPP